MLVHDIVYIYDAFDMWIKMLGLEVYTFYMVEVNRLLVTLVYHDPYQL